jgi:pantothenate synthetase
MATVVAAEPRITLEYAVVRDAVTLDLPSADGPLRLLIAGRIGGVRLIDNLAGPPDPPGGVEYPSPVPETDTELPA